MSLVYVHLCCNDPDNGAFSGRLLCVDYQGMELRHDDWLCGCVVRFIDDRRIRISRKVFQYAGRKEWVGNWCWDAIVMTRKEAHRLICYLRNSGTWACEAGPTRLFDWFKAAPNVKSIGSGDA